MTPKVTISDKVNKTRKFIEKDIWNLDMSTLSRFKASIIKDFRAIIIAISNFSKQTLGLRAVALSFFTTMAIIPFVAVIFAVANRAGLGEYLKQILFDTFENDELLVRVLSFADNIIATSHGPYGIISFLLFVWLVIWLFISVEKAFNTIWKVHKNRKTVYRMLSYLAVILVSPFIIIAVASVSLTVTDIADYINGVPVLAYTKDFLVWLAFFVLVSLFLSIGYILIPNAKVKFRCAIIAALIAAAAFTLVQYLYVETQLFVSRISAIYGVFAAFPLFMVWVNIAWFIVIAGADISFALQNIDSYEPLHEKFD